jgi:hypothetical protein
MPMNRLPRFILRRLSETYLRIAEGIDSVDICNAEAYLTELQSFRNGESGLILAFRHIAKADAPVLSAAFARVLPARFPRIAAADPDYFWVRFLFGDMVLDWAGAGARWLFPRIGTLPVSNQKLVRTQVEAIRSVMRRGEHPLCLAPEGQVNYYNERSGAVTHGLTHFIKWSLAERPMVRLLPISIEYRYPDPAGLEKRAVDTVSELLGGSIPVAAEGEATGLSAAVSSLLRWLGDYLNIPGARESDGNSGLLNAIRGRLLDDACESYGIDSGRRPLEKLFLYRNEVFAALRLSPWGVPAMARNIRRGWDAPETMSDLMIHYQRQQILDVLSNFDPDYHRGTADENRRAEQALYLMDIVNRIRGGDVNSRFFPPGTRAVMEFHPPREYRSAADAGDWIEWWRTDFNGS